MRRIRSPKLNDCYVAWRSSTMVSQLESDSESGYDNHANHVVPNLREDQRIPRSISSPTEAQVGKGLQPCGRRLSAQLMAVGSFDGLHGFRGSFSLSVFSTFVRSFKLRRNDDDGVDGEAKGAKTTSTTRRYGRNDDDGDDDDSVKKGQKAVGIGQASERRAASNRFDGLKSAEAKPSERSKSSSSRMERSVGRSIDRLIVQNPLGKRAR